MIASATCPPWSLFTGVYSQDPVEVLDGGRDRSSRRDYRHMRIGQSDQYDSFVMLIGIGTTRVRLSARNEKAADKAST